MLTEINELIAEKEIEVNGNTVKLNVFAGGDMKFMLIILECSQLQIRLYLV